MRSTSRRLTVFILAFTIGLSVAWSAALITKAEMLFARVSPSSIFRHDMHGRSHQNEQECGHNELYSLRDNRLLFENSFFSICKNIDERFQDEITKASKIIERVPNTNKNGIEGERVIILYYSENLKEERTKILWYSQDELTTIDAPSLEIALTFEEVAAFKCFKGRTPR